MNFDIIYLLIIYYFNYIQIVSLDAFCSQITVTVIFIIKLTFFLNFTDCNYSFKNEKKINCFYTPITSNKLNVCIDKTTGIVF